jgi:hypothetical protein
MRPEVLPVARSHNYGERRRGGVFLMRIDLHIHDDSTHADDKLDRILKLLEAIMATLDETLAAVNAESTVDDSIIALLDGLAAQIKAGGLSAADQTKVDAIFTAATANSAKVAADVLAHTAAAPPAVPAP